MKSNTRMKLCTMKLLLGNNINYSPQTLVLLQVLLQLPQQLPHQWCYLLNTMPEHLYWP